MKTQKDHSNFNFFDNSFHILKINVIFKEGIIASTYLQ